MRDRDSWLNATMIELADTGNGSFDESAYVGNFTERLAELLGPAEVSLLLLTEPAATTGGGKAAAAGREELAAGSGELAISLARLEAGGTAGPCTSCYRTGRPIRRLPLAEARSRWPEFTAAAGSAGLSSCCALPIRRQRETIGAVSVLTGGGHVPTPADFRLAQALAELAAIGILRQRELRQSQRLAQQLQHALDSRVIIEQAKGAVSAWLRVSPGDAFGLLRSYARALSRPLLQVADDVLAGATPPSALLTGGSHTRRAARRGLETQQRRPEPGQQRPQTAMRS